MSEPSSTTDPVALPTLQLNLPPWVESFLASQPRAYPSDDERMSLVVELSRRNVREGTGGPFAAAVFEGESGKLVAPGLNRVEPEACSVAHAEILALMMAQKMLGTFDLGAPTLSPSYELFASAEPCAMCYGAVPWSGVRRLVYGALKEDAEAVGFDEGSKPANWHQCLEERGIAVRGGVLRRDAAEVLQEYGQAGRTIYNSRGAS